MTEQRGNWPSIDDEPEFGHLCLGSGEGCHSDPETDIAFLVVQNFQDLGPEIRGRTAGNTMIEWFGKGWSGVSRMILLPESIERSVYVKTEP